MLEPTFETRLSLQPLVIEIFVDLSSLKTHETVVIQDSQGHNITIKEFLSSSNSNSKQWNEKTASIVVLERWRFEFRQDSIKHNSGLASPPLLECLLPGIYKKGIVLMRSLYTLVNVFPTSKLVKTLAREIDSLTTRSSPAVQARVIDANNFITETPDRLMTPLFDFFDLGSLYPELFTRECVLEGLETPMGTFQAQVCYRTDCKLSVISKSEIMDNTENGWSENDSARGRSRNSRDIDAMKRFRSLSTKRRTSESPDLTQAYGSLSTFHVSDRCESPISMLRKAPNWGPPEPEYTKSPIPAKMMPQGELYWPASSILVDDDYKSYLPSSDKRGRSPEKKSSPAHSRASSRGSGSSIASLQGVSTAPKELSFSSSSPTLRASHSSPDLSTSYSATAEHSGRRSSFTSFAEGQGHDDTDDVADLLSLLDNECERFPVLREDIHELSSQLGAQLLAFKNQGEYMVLSDYSGAAK